MVPAMVQVIAAVFLKEKPTWVQVCFILLSVSSLIVMVVLGSSQITFNPLGVALMLISSMAMAVNNVYTRYIRTQYKPIEISTAIIVFGTVLFNILFIGRGIIFGNAQAYFEPFQHTEFIIAVCYLGVGCILGSAQIMAYLQSKMQSAKAAVFGNVSTAISIVAGAVILGEPLYAYHIICSVFIIIGALGINFAGRRGVKNEVRISDGK
jgi:drug/metabolite transporter (DMT)-like permease